MRKTTFIFLLLLISGLCKSQEIISKEYYKDRFLTKTSTEKKGKFEYIVTQTEDGIIKQELLKNKNKQKVWIKYFKKDIPSGKWQFYNKDGSIRKELDYNFELKYNRSAVKTHTWNDIVNSPQKIINSKNSGTRKPPQITSPAMFKGGDIELQIFIEKNLWYPESARKNKIEGLVFVTFNVDENGKINNIQVAKGISTCLDIEAVRVIRLMPNWIPAKNNEENVTCKFSMPIRFVLQ